MSDMSCDQFHLQSAELALGILDGRERADALAHLEHCPSCRHELLLMGDVADRIVELTPTAEPPAGFETRVLAALKAPAGQVLETPPPLATPLAGRRLGASRPPLRDSRRFRVIMAVSAAALAVVLSVGGWLVGRGGSSAKPDDHVVTAAFVMGQQRVGEVIATTGSDPWISMAVDANLGDQKVICQLWEGNSAKVTIGSFQLSQGYGHWNAAIPSNSFPISGARLISPSGVTLATATFPHPIS